LPNSRPPAFSRIVEPSPLQHGGAFEMSAIANVRRNSAYPVAPPTFFSRTRARAANAARIFTLASGQKSVEFEDVLPVIPEVVPIVVPSPSACWPGRCHITVRDEPRRP
jgi:hypothetical protein